MNFNDKLDWSLRVKIMTPDVSSTIEELSQKYNIYVAKRVSCGVAVLLDQKSHNPYYFSPQLVGCSTCPQKSKCLPEKINDHVLEFCKKLGYDLEVVNKDGFDICQTLPSNRMDCPSCCTACYITENEKLLIKNKNITLADTAFLRFFTGVLATQVGIEDKGGDTAIAKVILENTGEEVHLVNSWYVWSRQLKECFGCTYCITEAYDINNSSFGCSPLQLFEKLSVF